MVDAWYAMKCRMWYPMVPLHQEVWFALQYISIGANYCFNYVCMTDWLGPGWIFTV